MQGLLNRRIGATSLNAESSRSHSVFTCIIESRCKVKKMSRNAVFCVVYMHL